MEKKVLCEKTISTNYKIVSFEKDGKEFEYLEISVLCCGIQVPLIVKDYNKIGEQLIIQKVITKDN